MCGIFYVTLPPKWELSVVKIIGFSNINGSVKMVLKGDSSLLVNRKPFFVPDWSNDVRMTPCVVLRVSRLGKNIQSRFATRYYDALALGLDMQAADYVDNGDMVRACAFDYSMVVGTFVDCGNNYWQDIDSKTIIQCNEAVHQVSQVMTIRQGDLLFVDYNIPPRSVERDEIITESIDNQEVLYCKIK